MVTTTRDWHRQQTAPLLSMPERHQSRAPAAPTAASRGSPGGCEPEGDGSLRDAQNLAESEKRGNGNDANQAQAIWGHDH